MRRECFVPAFFTAVRAPGAEGADKPSGAVTNEASDWLELAELSGAVKKAVPDLSEPAEPPAFPRM